MRSGSSRTALVAALAAGVLGLSGCLAAAPGAPDAAVARDAAGSAGSDASAPRYEDVQAIWDARCAGGSCHIGARFPQQGLDLGPGVSEALLVGVPSLEDPTRSRVEPGHPELSYLFAKLHPEGATIMGDPMPVGAPLPAEELEVVRAWITALPPLPPRDAGSDEDAAVRDDAALAGDAGAGEDATSAAPDAGAEADAAEDAGSLAEDATVAPDAAEPPDTGPPPDRAPPLFGGAAQAIAGPSFITVSWAPAVDDVTASDAIVYLVYLGAAAGAEDFTAPAFTTTPGALSAAVGGLAARTTYHFVVRAVDEAGNVDANTVEVSATTPARTDRTPPTFAGAVQATALSSAELSVSWSPATDDLSPVSAISYLVYEASAPGAESFAAPTAVTAPGATSYVASGLAPEASRWFVVRARDEAGNVDANTVEVTATTLADTAAPTFAGLSSASAPSATSVVLGWSAASDDVTPPSSIVYLVYQATGSGTPSFASPAYTTAPGATSFTIPNLSASTAYTFAVRARDEAGNVDANAVTRTVTTQAPPNAPPTFGGLTSASAASSSEIALAWSAASDDVTPPSSIVYLVYRATAPGAESYSSPTYTTAAGATSFLAGGLSPSTTYYFVVRARDANGAMDANVVELSATTPAAPITWSGSVFPLLQSSCARSGCHGGRAPAEGLSFDAAAAAYASLLGPSSQCPPTPLVTPGDPANSYLVWKLEGTGPCFTGSQMPKSAPPLSAAEMNVITTWIADGAPNN